MKANAIQETKAWMQRRAGSFTASRSKDLMARVRSGASASRANLLALLAIERLTGECVQTYQNAAMQRGIEMEAEGRDAYAFEHGVIVAEVGYVPSEQIARCGASPDGLVGNDGLLEIKCPASMQKHLDAIMSGGHVKEYRWQLQHQLMVTERVWVDAASYDPRFPDDLQLAVTRVGRNEKDINALIEEIHKADAEVEMILSELQTKRKTP